MRYIMLGIPGPFRYDFVECASMTHGVRLEIWEYFKPDPTNTLMKADCLKLWIINVPGLK